MRSFIVSFLCCLLIEFSSPQGVNDANYVFEVYFAVDPQVVKNYISLGYSNSTAEETVRGDFDFLIHQVNNYFKTLTKSETKVNIEIRPVKLDFLEAEVFDLNNVDIHNKIETGIALNTFTDWLSKNRVFQTTHYDSAMLLTGYSLYTGNEHEPVEGSSSDASACQKDSGGIIQFLGIQGTASSIAHELGHMLGMKHDIHDNATTNCAVSYEGYIMEERSHNLDGDAFSRWEFSSCSAAQALRFIKSLSHNCLVRNTASARTFNLSNQLGRDIFDPHKVCQRATLNKEGYFCSESFRYGDSLVQGDQVCQQISCSVEGHRDECMGYMPTEGMVCDQGKRCSRGKCVKAPADFPAPANVQKNCVFGNVRYGSPLSPNVNCSEAISREGAHMCYGFSTSADCCQTCSALKGDEKDCEFGNRNDFCEVFSHKWKSICSNEENRKICCKLCSQN